MRSMPVTPDFAILKYIVAAHENALFIMPFPVQRGLCNR